MILNKVSKSGASIVVDMPPVSCFSPELSMTLMASLTYLLTDTPSLVGKIANSAIIMV
jgi:hypothetical protein